MDITKREPQWCGTGADTSEKLVRKTPGDKAFAFFLEEIDGLNTTERAASP